MIRKRRPSGGVDSAFLKTYYTGEQVMYTTIALAKKARDLTARMYCLKDVGCVSEAHYYRLFGMAKMVQVSLQAYIAMLEKVIENVENVCDGTKQP
jgi:uncharacterized protein